MRVTPRLQLAFGDGDGKAGEQTTFEIMKGGANASMEEGLRDMRNGSIGSDTFAYMGEKILPDFRGKPMREVLRKGSELGIHVILEGTGLAVEQNPEPGVGLNKVSKVRVKFNPPI